MGDLTLAALDPFSFHNSVGCGGEMLGKLPLLQCCNAISGVMTEVTSYHQSNGGLNGTQGGGDSLFTYNISPTQNGPEGAIWVAHILMSTYMPQNVLMTQRKHNVIKHFLKWHQPFMLRTAYRNNTVTHKRNPKRDKVLKCNFHIHTIDQGSPTFLKL